MHIADQVTAELIKQGFTVKADGSFAKIVPTGGEFDRTTLTLRMDDSGRWLERINGWGTVEADADLRNFENNPIGAIAKATKG
jgi:hypothetical protein